MEYVFFLLNSIVPKNNKILQNKILNVTKCCRSKTLVRTEGATRKIDSGKTVIKVLCDMTNVNTYVELSIRILPLEI
jgi:hypothetical protein